MKSTRFHATNYGFFAEGIPTDQEGYAYTTQREWMRAKLDWGQDTGRGSRAYRMERCKELAAQTRSAVRKADLALAAWRTRNH